MNQKMTKFLSKMMAFLILLTSMPVNVLAAGVTVKETARNELKLEYDDPAGTKKVFDKETGSVRGEVISVRANLPELSEDPLYVVLNEDENGKSELVNSALDVTFKFDDSSGTTGVSGYQDITMTAHTFVEEQEKPVDIKLKEGAKKGDSIVEFNATIANNGIYIIKAEDRAGNVTEQQIVVNIIDKQDPVVNGFYISSEHHDPDVISTKPLHLSVTVKDMGSSSPTKESKGGVSEDDVAVSGINRIELWNVRGNQDEIYDTKNYEDLEANERTHMFEVTHNGEYYLKVYDNAGNILDTSQSGENENKIEIDNLIPKYSEKDDDPKLEDKGGKDWSIKPVTPKVTIYTGKKTEKVTEEDGSEKEIEVGTGEETFENQSWGDKKYIQLEEVIDKDNKYNITDKIMYSFGKDSEGNHKWVEYDKENKPLLEVSQNTTVYVKSISKAGVDSNIKEVVIINIANPDTEGWTNDPARLNVKLENKTVNLDMQTTDPTSGVENPETNPMKFTEYTITQKKVKYSEGKWVVEEDSKETVTNKFESLHSKHNITDLPEGDYRFTVEKHNETGKNSIINTILIRSTGEKDKDGNPIIEKMPEDVIVLDNLEKAIEDLEKYVKEKDKEVEEGKEEVKNKDYLDKVENDLNNIKDIIKDLEEARNKDKDTFDRWEDKIKDLLDRAKDLQDNFEKERRDFTIVVKHVGPEGDELFPTTDRVGVKLLDKYGYNLQEDGDNYGVFKLNTDLGDVKKETLYVGDSLNLNLKRYKDKFNLHENIHTRDVEDYQPTLEGLTIGVEYVGQEVTFEIPYERKTREIEVFAKVKGQDKPIHLGTEVRGSGLSTLILVEDQPKYRGFVKDHYLIDFGQKDHMVIEFPGEESEKLNQVFFEFDTRVNFPDAKPEETPEITDRPGGVDRPEKPGVDYPVIGESYYTIRYMTKTKPTRDIIPPQHFKAKNGTKITVPAKSFDNYTEIKGNRTLIVGRDAELVIYYNPIHGGSGEFEPGIEKPTNPKETFYWVRYVDQEDSNLKRPYHTKAIIGSKVTVYPEEIYGYTLVNNLKGKTIVLKKDPKQNLVTFVYEESISDEDRGEIGDEWEDGKEVEHIPNNPDPMSRTTYRIKVFVDGELSNRYSYKGTGYIGERISHKAVSIKGLTLRPDELQKKTLTLNKDVKKNVIEFYYLTEKGLEEWEKENNDKNKPKPGDNKPEDGKDGELFPDGNVPEFGPGGGTGGEGVDLDGTVNDKGDLNFGSDDDKFIDWDSIKDKKPLTGDDARKKLEETMDKGAEEGRDYIFIDNSGKYRPEAQLVHRDGEFLVVDGNGNPMIEGGYLVFPDGSIIVVNPGGTINYNGDTGNFLNLGGGSNADFINTGLDGNDGIRSGLDGFLGANYGKGSKVTLDKENKNTLDVNKNKYKDTIKGQQDLLNPMLEKSNHDAFIEGDPTGNIRPNDPISREETVTIVYRILDEGFRNENRTKEHNFSDVKEGRWSEEYIATLSAIDIVKGRTDTEFAPSSNITRAEAATLLSRFSGENVNTNNVNIPDIEGHWAEENIKKAFALGWITGYEDGTFRPNNDITRAELVVIVNKMLGRTPKLHNMIIPEIKLPDVKETDWYYVNIIEALFGHEYVITNGEEVWIGLKQQQI